MEIVGYNAITMRLHDAQPEQPPELVGEDRALERDEPRDVVDHEQRLLLRVEPSDGIMCCV